MSWSFFTFSKTHAGKVRPYNEDALLDMSARRVWVVADGMGGHSAGDVASQMLVDRIERFVLDTPDFGIDELRQMIEVANREIFQYAQVHLDGKTMGSTVVLLFLQDGYFHCLWVGDSRIYLLRDNHLVQKTRDHSQVMELVEQGLLAEEDAEKHPLANVITRAVGVEETVRIDQQSGQLLHGDQFLLCSDGLTKELSNSEIHQIMCADSVNQSGLALLHASLVRGANDNVTCALIKVAKEKQLVQEGVSHSSDATVPVYARRRV
ncbi:serine/threonine-protein phosphatase [Vibrio vulnificus]|uniref:PP2C family protein-serine/threonine phosphatase n=1 Tax=Vibrio vulnificus TaxID=672 RepID=UPI001CDCB0D6|nr:protein phosphatase 2C domain-containing protein [Vibrio vulnificus]MCA3961311.1 serine/threonine-protein phosphatase [Vibrio vulnificus]HDY7702574.1 serine/threonine-protein phosphatase [Vibrio vulnificus]HDY7765244.1 serine/threonine-protein phosphatase [Vibrio vulnificus]HDY7782823.1 serine/threonine-protein phosphatase [Vibrio vulnificus]HDY7792509.1 serine/threonine-protein phosphatase [Vibrio vulnificus]